MKRISLVLAAAALAACARTTSLGTAPSGPDIRLARPVPPPDPAAPMVAVDSDEAGLPRNWQLLDQEKDHIAGVSAERALAELLAGQQPRRTVVVAVIDGGVDTAHAGLRSMLWSNPRETAGNQADDDHNGFVDDMRGWNFIGGKNGRNIDHDTFEATRLYGGCKKRAPGGFGSLPEAEREQCNRAAGKVEGERKDMAGMVSMMQQAATQLTAAIATLKTALRTDSVTEKQVEALQPATADVRRAKETYVFFGAQGLSPAEIEKDLKEVRNRLDYGYNVDYNPRPIVGDDTLNVREHLYGNPDVTGPDASHGTHVAGIIGGAHNAKEGFAGIAPGVRIMAVRAIPDGDERDKDVANAIRYAVDNGANVINMSFGKDFSPAKSVVDEAVRYADQHGVLMIHAAGNDGANTDSTDNFPNARYLAGGQAERWLEVGASSWRGGTHLAADFSNYGRGVDLFAPGEDILSTVPGNGYERESGTSMAAPVVTGVAALLMAYFPELNALDVKHVLVNSAARHPGQSVLLPGTKRSVLFGSLSSTGGIVNAYAAVKMAQQMVGHR